jgi:hypothetical protein
VNWYTLSGSDGQPNVLVRLQWPKVQEYVSKDFPFWRSDPDLAMLDWGQHRGHLLARGGRQAGSRMESGAVTDAELAGSWWR